MILQSQENFGQEQTFREVSLLGSSRHRSEFAVGLLRVGVGVYNILVPVRPARGLGNKDKRPSRTLRRNIA